VLTATDYYPFGMEMPGRKYNPQGYRYGFNGKENDRSGEWGLGLVQDYGFRLYNSGLSRFFSVDPLTESYPWNSTYAFAENDVIRCIDLEGGEKSAQYTWDNKTTTPNQQAQLKATNFKEIDPKSGHDWDVLQKMKHRTAEKGYGQIETHQFILKAKATKQQFEKLKNTYSTDPGKIHDSSWADYDPIENPYDGDNTLSAGDGMDINILGPYNALVRFSSVLVNDNSFQINADIMEAGLPSVFGAVMMSSYNHPDAGSIVFSGNYDAKKSEMTFSITHRSSMGNAMTYLANSILLSRYLQQEQWKTVIDNAKTYLEIPNQNVIEQSHNLQEIERKNPTCDGSCVNGTPTGN
jgi:RHS repeat-associated protein